MPNFCVNAQAADSGHHEVHDVGFATTCLPEAADRIDLGEHSDCLGALDAARGHGFDLVNGCYWCATDCHMG